MLLNVKYNQLFKHIFFTSGRHFYEVEIEKMSEKKTIVIGVSPSENFEGETLNGPLSSWIAGAMGYCANGALVVDGKEVAQVKPYEEGDFVGVYLDMNQKIIRFFLNGEEQQQESPLARPLRYQQSLQQSQQLPAITSTGSESFKPIRFTSGSLFAAVTLSPATDEVHVFHRELPFWLEMLPSSSTTTTNDNNNKSSTNSCRSSSSQTHPHKQHIHNGQIRNHVLLEEL